jgi:uncharacterized protein DUF3761
VAGGAILPSSTRTPGATNPRVTQATIHSTICVSGWTRTVRPSSSYTTGLKLQQLASGYAYQGDTNPSDYEEDHLIPLELGGSPSSPLNLWPELYHAADGAYAKDSIENHLHSLVCAGQLSLTAAQQAIANNWWTAELRYGNITRHTSAPVTHAPAPAPASTTSQAPPPPPPAPTSEAAPAGATAICNDGTYSYSQHHSGTCSHHGGVRVWW